MAAALLTAKRLNAMRKRLYGTSAALRVYKLPAGAAPSLLATVTDGWYVQRQGYRQGNETDAKQSLLLLIKSAISEATLHQVARVEVDANGETFAFNVDDKAPSQQLGAGYIVPLTQITATTV